MPSPARARGAPWMQRPTTIQRKRNKGNGFLPFHISTIMALCTHHSAYMHFPLHIRVEKSHMICQRSQAEGTEPGFSSDPDTMPGHQVSLPPFPTQAAGHFSNLILSLTSHCFFCPLLHELGKEGISASVMVLNSVTTQNRICKPPCEG